MRTVLAAIALAAAGEAFAQARASLEERRLVEAVVDALKDGDAPALAELVDFPRRMQEGMARGTAPVGWDALDELGQVLERKQTGESWVEAHRQFMSSARLYQLRGLDDPDAGLGPVPDRRILQAVVKSSRAKQLVDVLVIATPDGALLDVVFGEPYTSGANPAGDEGLQPTPLPELEVAAVRWPASLDDDDRAEVYELIDQLTEARGREAIALTVEYLHRSPRAAVTALLERVLELQQEETPDAVLQARFLDAVETITGRVGDFRAVAPLGWDREQWQAANGAELAAWVVWHEHHGARFAAAPIVDPIEPTFHERDPTSRSTHLPRAGSSLTSVGTLPEPPALSPEAGALEVLYRGQVTLAAELGPSLPLSVRDVLEGWHDAAGVLELRFALTGNGEHVVLGGATDEVLAHAADVLDRTWELLDPVLPVIGHRQSRATTALLFSPDFTKGEHWEGLLAVLVDKGIIVPDLAEVLRRDAQGVTLRGFPAFLQPTWDMVGNSAAGDDEFRLDNELAHKFAQCLVTSRCGQQPDALLWALGHFVENRLFQSVFQFKKTGFVAVDDHYRWAQEAERLIGKRSRKRGFSLAERLLEPPDHDRSLEGPRMAWGTVEYLYAQRQQLLRDILEDLADIHAQTDPYGLQPTYQGDPQATLDSVESHLAQVDVKVVREYLDELD